jgi:hypothetical protein
VDIAADSGFVHAIDQVLVPMFMDLARYDALTREHKDL